MCENGVVVEATDWKLAICLRFDYFYPCQGLKPLARVTVYTVKLQSSPTTCVKPNAIAGSYKHTCFKPPENAEGLAQFAGNKMQSQEVTSRYVYNKM